MEYLFFPIAAIAVYFLIRYFSYLDNKKARLQNEYRAALNSGDKSKALDAGRRYYAHLRGGSLSIYDEQAIANDISVMNTND